MDGGGMFFYGMALLMKKNRLSSYSINFFHGMTLPMKENGPSSYFKGPFFPEGYANQNPYTNICMSWNDSVSTRKTTRFLTREHC